MLKEKKVVLGITKGLLEIGLVLLRTFVCSITYVSYLIFNFYVFNEQNIGDNVDSKIPVSNVDVLW